MLCKQWTPQHALQIPMILTKSLSVCVQAPTRISFFHRAFTGRRNQGWVGPILPAPTPSPGPARAADVPPAGGGLKAARHAPHVRRQHQRRLQLHSLGSPSCFAQGLSEPAGLPGCRDLFLDSRGSRPARLPPGLPWPRPISAPQSWSRWSALCLAIPAPRHPRGACDLSGFRGSVGPRGTECAGRRARRLVPCPCSSASRHWGQPHRRARRGLFARPLGFLHRWPHAASAARRLPP